ncbi:MAG: ABC transporter substrate-binding protein [Actinobacteria bacterium]|nr:ABC transporter substrate-binding protein [Actinomycetota bacterium]
MRGFRVLAALFAVTLAVFAVGPVGCGGETTTTTASTTETTIGAAVPFKFALAGPMSGQYANYGASHAAGADIAVEELNARGGVNGGEASYVSGDDLGDSKEAALVAQKLIDDADVLFVNGHMFSGATLAAGPKYEETGLPMISPSATNPDISTLGDSIWRISMTDSVQGEGLANYTMDDLGFKKVAIVYDDGVYGRSVADAYEAAFKAGGGEVVAREQYTAGDADFKAQVTKIKQAGPELIFLSGYYSDGSKIVQQAAELGIQVTWLGSDGYASDELAALGGAAVEGVLASTFFDNTNNDPAVQGFVEAYRAKHDGANPDWFAASSYDVVMLAAAAAEAAGSNDRAAINAALGSMGTYQGITGAITFDENGDALRSLTIVVVKDGELVTAPVQPTASVR